MEKVPGVVGKREGLRGVESEAGSVSSARVGEEGGTLRGSEGEVAWERRTSEATMLVAEGRGRSKHGVIDTVRGGMDDSQLRVGIQRREEGGGMVGFPTNDFGMYG